MNIEDWGLPTEILERIGPFGGRQRTIFENGNLLILLHFPPQVNDRRRRPYYIWIKPDNSIKTLPEDLSPQDLIEQYYAEIKELEDQYEDANQAVQYFSILEKLVPIHLAATRLHGTLQNARELKPKQKSILSWRDDSWEIERIAEILLINNKNALDYCNAQSTEQMAKISNKMNKMAYLLIPLMALGGIFGMNIKSGLNEENPTFFWIIMVIGISIGILNLIILNKKT